MNRLKKELNKAGITYACSDGYDPIESESELIAVENGFIVTFHSCNVLNPTFTIWDKNLKPVGEQNAFYDHLADNGEGWDSRGIVENEDGVWVYPSTTPPKSYFD